MKMQIADIIVDESVLPRELDPQLVSTYVNALLAGAVFPPIVVDANTKRLVGGRHRLEAHKKRNTQEIDIELKTYASEADLFLDAVRMNTSHGLALNSYERRAAAIRLEQLGFTREQISVAVQVPIDKLDVTKGGFATSEEGGTMAIKGGLRHLSGQTLSPKQIEAQRRFGGPGATFHANQLIEVVENDIFPRTKAFIEAMDTLTGMWAEHRPAEKE
jgi:hypothetical protein